MWNVLNTLCPADQEMEEEKNPLQLQNAEIHKGLVVPQRKKGKEKKKWKIISNKCRDGGPTISGNLRVRY